MAKIIWALIGINTLALLVFIGAYFILNAGKNVDYQEKGWTITFAGIGLVAILLAAVPLYYCKSATGLFFSGFFAVLPLAIFTWNKLPSFKKEKTFAETFYKDKAQRKIAAAIENNDTTLLKELVKGQDLNIQGTRVWDTEGFNYLQFAVHLRSNPISFPFNDSANKAAIKILLEHGADPTSALPEATNYLPLETIILLLDAGANPNCKGYEKPNPLLFYKIGPDKNQNDIAILLLQRGASKNAINDEKRTPVMEAAFRAGTTERWADAWRVVRYLLEQAQADYTYTNSNGVSLTTIIRGIRVQAIERKIEMPADFMVVVEWLKQHNIDTTPVIQ